jgi:mono/diheme cytochrome c family protein
MRYGLLAIGAATIAMIAAPHRLWAQEDERARQAYQVLKANCFECHGESRKGGLDLRTHATLIKGSASGRVVVPHEPSRSRLYLLASHADPDEVMPPKGPRISDEDLEALRLWIEDGASLEDVEEAAADDKKSPELLAKLEEKAITPEERQYWAFKRPSRTAVPALPASAPRSWTRNPIDRFLFASMNAKGLTPSPRADRRALIRRAYLDVLGLPPAP